MKEIPVFVPWQIPGHQI